MSLLYRRLLQNVTLSAGETTDLLEGLDLGEYREVHVVLTVVSAGSGSAVKLVARHAPLDDEDSYLDFDTPMEISLTETGSRWFHADAFTRFVSCFVSGTLESDAIVTVDLVAKS